MTGPNPDQPAKRIGRDCQDASCPVTVSDQPLYRVNRKGELGVFMCLTHAAAFRGAR